MQDAADHRDHELLRAERERVDDGTDLDGEVLPCLLEETDRDEVAGVGGVLDLDRKTRDLVLRQRLPVEDLWEVLDRDQVVVVDVCSAPPSPNSPISPTRARTSIPISAAPSSSTISISSARSIPARAARRATQGLRLRSRARQTHRRVRAQGHRIGDAARLSPPGDCPPKSTPNTSWSRWPARKAIRIDEGVRLALEAILVSPDFLFHIERDPKAAAAAHPVSDHEFAARLSYFLWASMPDDELSRLADQGTGFTTPVLLEAQVRRMMADPKASNLVDNFAAQWLQLRNLGRTKPDPQRFPTVDDELLDDMRKETSLFVGAIIQEDRSVLDFLDAPFTFVNGILARHYGIPGVSGEEFQRVTLDGERRGGILTQGAILTVSSYPTRTSPPVRGKWVLENLLGAAPPPPPPDVPVLNEANLGKTVSMRERMEQHRKDPSCAVCHNQMDPIGFGLESYDAVGAWRDKDGDDPHRHLGRASRWQIVQGREGSEGDPARPVRRRSRAT